MSKATLPPSKMSPVYRATTGAGYIDLGEAPVNIKHENGIFAGRGRASLKLQPRFILSIDAEFTNSPWEAHIALSQAAMIEFSYAAVFGSSNALVTKLSLQGDKETTRLQADLMPTPQRMTYGEPHEKIASLLCHLINFPIFLSVNSASADARCETKTGGWILLGRAVLDDSPWQIVLQQTPEASASVKELKDMSGYGITHVARLTRQDNASFTVKEAAAVVQNLYLFLSFARGAWSPPVLSVGFDEAGERIHEDWGVRIATPWEVQRSWFDHHHGESLNDLYRGFRSLLHEGNLGKAVSAALYWYLRSNRGGEGSGIDSGVILSQAALERLSSAYLEANEVLLPKRAGAAEQLRETLLRLQIPVAIPDKLSALIDSQSKSGWKDGPEAIARIRNELVHPKKKLPFNVGVVIPDAWNLSQWYIELIILRLAGYNGVYSNRLRGRWVGEVERVPWATR